VLIVGGGFGGLTAAQSLKGIDVDVTLIDRSNYHLFQPLLYQVAMAGLAPTEIASPIRTILRKQRNVQVLLGEVMRIDLEHRTLFVRGESDRTMSYDYLILAAGARTNYFGHDEWSRWALGLKDLDEAVAIRRRVLVAFEAAEFEADSAKRKGLLTFVVIGGGPTGVELAGALAELSRRVLARDFRVIDPSQTHVLLLEGGPRILPAMDETLSKKALDQLKDLGVEVRLGATVTAIDAHGVHVGGELVPSTTVIWAAGVRASPLADSLPIERDRAGRIIVQDDCSIPGHPEAFAIGDIAHFKGADGKPLPGVSPVAMQQARFVATMIERSMHNQPRRAFEYWDKGTMATIGRSRAVAQAAGFKLSGFIAWLAWLFVHIWYLIGFRNRFLVLFDWFWAYVLYRRGARIITGRVIGTHKRAELAETSPSAPADAPKEPEAFQTPH
jgi:NADH dehydrogenase